MLDPVRRRCRKPKRLRSTRPAVDTGARRLLPLGALAAGFGLIPAQALSQTQTQTQPAAAPTAAASAPAGDAARQTTMPAIAVKAKQESDATSLRATTTSVAKGTQDVLDVPQSVTVVTERLMDERRVDTLDEALKLMGGISFLAAEGGE